MSFFSPVHPFGGISFYDLRVYLVFLRFRTFGGTVASEFLRNITMETTNHQESIEKKKSVGYRAPFFYDCFFFGLESLCGRSSFRLRSPVFESYLGDNCALLARVPSFISLWCTLIGTQSPPHFITRSGPAGRKSNKFPNRLSRPGAVVWTPLIVDNRKKTRRCLFCCCCCCCRLFRRGIVETDLADKKRLSPADRLLISCS